ncbi:hypothetical protein PRIPAC_95331 [Pristionchus pacificus]|uniref:Uncharacterized protein n=1 Tax=Pristionchus pacificus TaxID=54126 RepID=A0A2A6D2R2_PRIPA|nr:hypothetical protein PRIPAC_95331 [Pristionchus pacificus]|eukprot:PDM84724.1 hypothetical protein PRIPAC_33747 [Pristionchus pacificus]
MKKSYILHSPFFRSRRVVDSHPRSLPSSVWRILVRQLGQPDEYRPSGSSRGRILIGSSDLRSRKTPLKKTASTSAAGWTTSILKSHRLNATSHRQLKAKKIPSLDPLPLSTKNPIPSIMMFPPAGTMP